MVKLLRFFQPRPDSGRPGAPGALFPEAIRIAALASILASSCGALHAQVSGSAYRVLGQPDLRHNGVNMVQGLELRTPGGIALDSRGGQTHIYIADSGNARVLAWSDVNSYQAGDAPTLTLGQPGPQYSNPLGIGSRGFSLPVGLAVDPNNGNLYVADETNNRVLRFPAPFSNPSRIEPDAVYGQANFNTSSAGVSPTTLNRPRSLAFDSSGNLWVADTGNSRVVRYPAGLLNSPAPVTADAVVGQKDLFTSTANAGGTTSSSGLDGPDGLAFDAQNNLYVADLNNARVLRFNAPLGQPGVTATASGVWGQSNFTSKTIPNQANASSVATPIGIAVDNTGSLYIAASRDNRVLAFPLTPSVGTTAKMVLGQADMTSTSANAGVFPQASPNTLSAPNDVKVDQNGNVFVVDTSNHRVLEFPSGSKSATRVWGQSDFVSNGANQVKPGSINTPFKMAIDYSQAPFALYVSDAANHRVLVWRDSVRFRNGDPADMVIGQPNLRTAVANVDTQGIPSQTSLSSPAGIVVNRFDGTVYVADSGNNRVLRYPRPVNQSGRITPDAVIGQPDFTSATFAAVNGSSLNSPRGLALGPNGNLFVSDFGNNRVLEFADRAGNGASAVRVYGQPNMNSSTRPSRASAQTVASPQGIAVDEATNLYVTDTGTSRVLIFPNTQNAPPSGMAAAFVVGQSVFDGTGQSLLKVPTDVSVDSNGNIFVADSGNNRVLAFQPLIFLPISGAQPSGVIGQQNSTGTTPNWNSPDGLPTADALYTPTGLYTDRQDTLYVGDVGNNRVLQFLKAAVVQNAASSQTGIAVAQGSIASLYGAGLAGEERTSSGTTWPTSLLNRQIVVNDELPAPVYYVGTGQANFQVPSNSPLGPQRIAMRVADTGELIAGGSLLVASSGPGLFTVNQRGTGAAAAYNQDNTLNSASNAAARGSVITLYGTGQGQVSPAVPDGTPAPGAPFAVTVAVPTADARSCQNNQPAMCVQLSTAFGEVQFTGLIPGFIGLWQINVKIPQETPTGAAVPVRVVINGTPSNIVTVAIR